MRENEEGWIALLLLLYLYKYNACFAFLHSNLPCSCKTKGEIVLPHYFVCEYWLCVNIPYFENVFFWLRWSFLALVFDAHDWHRIGIFLSQIPTRANIHSFLHIYRLCGNPVAQKKIHAVILHGYVKFAAWVVCPYWKPTCDWRKKKM